MRGARAGSETGCGSSSDRYKPPWCHDTRIKEKRQRGVPASRPKAAPPRRLQRCRSLREPVSPPKARPAVAIAHFGGFKAGELLD